MKIKIVLFIIVLYISIDATGQNQVFNELRETEMSIPSAPAFALLGVNPEMVMRPSDLRSFKVDWRIKNYNLAPDLALEAQPLWHFYFKKKSFNDYLSSGSMIKKMSTMSVSIGTAKIDGINHASYSIKLNLYKKNDPLYDKDLIAQLENEHQSQNVMLSNQLDSLISLRYNTTNPKRKDQIEIEMDKVRNEQKTLSETSKLKYREVIEQYNGTHWNRTMLDGAFGAVYTYDNAGLDSLKVKRAGLALWLNGCLKMGDNGLLSSIIRYTKISDSSNKMLGISYRYGSQKYNFYAELIYESLGNYFDPDQEQPFDNDEYLSTKYIEDLGSGWFNFNNDNTKTQYTMAYGGDFRISKNILLNFALRTQFTSDIKLTRLLPVANIVCLMK